MEEKSTTKDNINNYTMADFKILLTTSLFKRDGSVVGNGALNAVTIKELIETTKYSHVKIRQTLDKFISIGYIDNGIKIGKSKTYYATEEGFSFIEELKINNICNKYNEGE